MNIIFLGPPGSGKGTQAKQLAEKKGLTHLSTGDLFRENISKQTELGKEIKSYVDSGRLVPDELVSKVVFEKICDKSQINSFLLDGYPRTVDQAKALDLFLTKNNLVVDAVIFFDVDFSELVNRLSARRTCAKCKEVFNLINKSPKKENICDSCGGELIQRPDDKAEIVQDRLRIYKKQTEPILVHYKNSSGFIQVNAGQGIEKVYQDIDYALSVLK
ncbi:MAG: adenylate kinase [Elusimicrobiota bacterium]